MATLTAPWSLRIKMSFGEKLEQEVARWRMLLAKTFRPGKKKMPDNKSQQIQLVDQHEFWRLLARKLAGVATLRDSYELHKLVYAHPGLQFWVTLVTNLWRKREAIEKEPGGGRSIFATHKGRF